MTRRHFQMIANIVKGIKDLDTRQQVAMDFAHALRGENPRFDICRFVDACGGRTTTNGGLQKVTF